MPDILIRGMEMPKKCNQIQITIFGDGFSGKPGAFIVPRNGIPTEDDLVYDAIEIPSPHGDLIDRDWLKEMAYSKVEDFGCAFVDSLDIAITPTVVPANKEEST